MTDDWDRSDWERFLSLWPRRIEGRWHWLKHAERRTVYIGGAMGACCDLWRFEYRCCK